MGGVIKAKKPMAFLANPKKPKILKFKHLQANASKRQQMLGFWHMADVSDRFTGGESVIDKLLINGPVLLVIPSLAMRIGLNEAIVLQQIHYWVQYKEKAQKDNFDGRFWVYNTYEQWQTQFPFWSVTTIRRTIRSLERQGLLLSGTYNKAGFDKTKWYTIDYGALKEIVQEAVQLPAQNGQTICSSWIDGCAQNEQANTIDYLKVTEANILKRLKGAEPPVLPCQHIVPFDRQGLEWQIKKSCSNLGIEDCGPYIDIIECYYSTYWNFFRREHPHLSEKAMNTVICAIQDGCEMLQDFPLDVECYQEMIKKHFETKYQNCDYNICHFMTEGVRNNRFYETCY